VLGLKWGDVDFERSTLTVQRQLQRNKSFKEPKAHSRRPLDLAPSELAVLREPRRAQDALRLAQGAGWEAHDLIFCTDRGRPLNWRNVTREYKRFLARADLPDLRFHDLRHSNATILAAAGVPPKVIQERLGHADITTTLGFYGHATPAMGKEAARKLEDLLHGEDGG
jgi:integrase